MVLLNVDRGGNACIFWETNGVADFIQAIPLSEEQKNQTTYQLKVERETENGPFNFYLDGNLIHTRELPEFPGGYFGLNACNATLTFNNVNYTVNGGALEGFSHQPDWMEGPQRYLDRGIQRLQRRGCWQGHLCLR